MAHEFNYGTLILGWFCSFSLVGLVWFGLVGRVWGGSFGFVGLVW